MEMLKVEALSLNYGKQTIHCPSPGNRALGLFLDGENTQGKRHAQENSQGKYQGRGGYYSDQSGGLEKKFKVVLVDQQNQKAAD